MTRPISCREMAWRGPYFLQGNGARRQYFFAEKNLDTSYQNIYQPFRDIILKPVLSGHSKIDKPKVLKTGDSLVQVESAELLT